MELETVYTAAMERERVRAQQRTPEPFVPVRPVSPREVIRALLASRVEWWTVDAVTAALRADRRQVVSCLGGLVHEGLVERERPAIKGSFIHKGARQRYRWIPGAMPRKRRAI